MRVLINPLSAHSQFACIEQAQSALEALTSALDLLVPATLVGAAQIIYDSAIESRGLLTGSRAFASCLGKISDKDTKDRWYVLTRNRAIDAIDEYAECRLEASEEVLSGQVSIEFLSDQVLFGFSGSPACEAAEVLVYEAAAGAVKNTRKSVKDVDAAWRLLPRYEASPKHGVATYIREGGELVSPMTLSTNEAQQCLLCSFPICGDRFGYWDGKFVRFKLTRGGDDGAVYHGFEQAAHELPAEALLILKRANGARDNFRP